MRRVDRITVTAERASPEPEPRIQTRVSTVRVVERAFSILEHLATEEREFGLTELSAAVGISVATTHRVLRTLVDRGYVRQSPTRGYALGAGLLKLGDKARTGMVWSAEPRLRELADAIGHTTGLAVLDGADVTFLAQAAPRHSVVRVSVELGQRVPSGATAIRDVLLASLPDNGGFPSPRATGGARTVPADVAARVRAVRRRGYAIDEHDGLPPGGIHSIAIGVAGSTVPVALAVLGVPATCATERRTRMVELLRTTSARISEQWARRHR